MRYSIAVLDNISSLIVSAALIPGNEQSESKTNAPAAAAGVDLPAGDARNDDTESPLFDLSLIVERQGLACRFSCLGHTAKWTVPKTVVRRANKAMSIDHLFDILGAGPILGCCLHNAETDQPDFQLVPRAVNALTERVSKEIRLAMKKGAAGAATVKKDPGGEANSTQQRAVRSLQE